MYDAILDLIENTVGKKCHFTSEDDTSKMDQCFRKVFGIEAGHNILHLSFFLYFSRECFEVELSARCESQSLNEKIRENTIAPEQYRTYRTNTSS
jgi:hypothetical protein